MVKAILFLLYKLKVQNEIAHFAPGFLFCQQIQFLTLSLTLRGKVLLRHEELLQADKTLRYDALILHHIGGLHIN